MVFACRELDDSRVARCEEEFLQPQPLAVKLEPAWPFAIFPGRGIRLIIKAAGDL